MSLDTRLRDGLGQAAATVDPDVERRLARTRQLHGRRRTRRRLVLAAAAVVVLLVAVPAVHRVQGTDRAVPAGPLTDAQAREQLMGRWVTPVVNRHQVGQTLQAAGLEQYLDDVALDLGYPVAWSMVLAKDEYSIISGPGVLADHGSWSVAGTTLTLRPTECPCTITFSWLVRDDRLTLTMIDEASPPRRGVPDEAFARALYTTVPFYRPPTSTP